MLLSTSDVDEWYLMQDENPVKDLYGELQLTAKRFTDLAHRLQENTTIRKKTLKVDQAAQTDSCCDEINMKLMESQAENLRLRQNLKDVTDINRRWHEYNSTRQRHVHYLQESLIELRETVAALRHRKSAELSPNEDYSAALVVSEIAEGEETSSGAEEMDERPKTPSVTRRTSFQARKTPLKHAQSYESVMSMYRDILGEKEKLFRRVQEMQPQVADLRHRLQMSHEECELLRIQLKTFRNDWKSEQMEKEDALAKIRQINEELSTLKQKCNHYIHKIQVSKPSSECVYCKGCRRSKMEKNLDLDDLLKSKVIEMNNRRYRHRRTEPDKILCTVDGVQVRLLERCSRENLMPEATESDSEKQLQNSSEPFVTFPSNVSCIDTRGDMGELEGTESPISAEVNRTSSCPLSSKSFRNNALKNSSVIARNFNSSSPALTD